MVLVGLGPPARPAAVDPCAPAQRSHCCDTSVPTLRHGGGE